MDQSQIIGIFLVHNEDCFVKQAIHNVFSFCDRLLLIDHASSDQTLSILRGIQQEHPEKVSLYQIHHPRESHELLKPFVGTATWVFGVDGDELYDPAQLLAFRSRLLSGEFDQDWMILGNVLHVEELKKEIAEGYLTPPSRSITKLYNFAAIESWEGKTLERLHGGTPCFRPGFHEQKKRRLFEEESWEDSCLRCLHLCFIPRSHTTHTAIRKNIMETYTNGWSTIIKNKIFCWLGRSMDSSWKRKHYARGERQTVDASPFFQFNQL